LPGKDKVQIHYPFPFYPDFKGMMRPGNNQSTPFLICLRLGARQGRRALRRGCFQGDGQGQRIAGRWQNLKSFSVRVKRW
jgi:hypothetical protein